MKYRYFQWATAKSLFYMAIKLILNLFNTLNARFIHALW